MEIEIKSAKQLNRIKGNIGEEKAVLFLKDNKYAILQRNFRTTIGEIDIIAKKDDRIIFVEVKQKQTARYGMPREMVTQAKQRRIKKVAELYLKINGLLNSPTRFDVIEILAENLVHLQGAF